MELMNILGVETLNPPTPSRSWLVHSEDRLFWIFLDLFALHLQEENIQNLAKYIFAVVILSPKWIFYKSLY